MKKRNLSIPLRKENGFRLKEVFTSKTVNTKTVNSKHHGCSAAANACPFRSPREMTSQAVRLRGFSVLPLAAAQAQIATSLLQKGALHCSMRAVLDRSLLLYLFLLETTPRWGASSLTTSLCVGLELDAPNPSQLALEPSQDICRWST